MSFFHYFVFSCLPCSVSFKVLNFMKLMWIFFPHIQVRYVMKSNYPDCFAFFVLAHCNPLQGKYRFFTGISLCSNSTLTCHTDPNWSILSNKYNPGQPIQKPGFWLSNRPFCTETLEETIESGPLCITDLFQNKISL